MLPQTFEDLGLFLNAFNARFDASLNDLKDLNMESLYLEGNFLAGLLVNGTDNEAKSTTAERF